MPVLYPGGGTGSGITGSLELDGPSPWIDVKAYGATGDGVTDDSAAIQAAIDAVPASGGTVFFPIGIYIVNTTITLTDRENLRLVGSGANHTIYAGPTLAYKGTVLKRLSGTSTILDWSASASTDWLRGNGISGITFQGWGLAVTGVRLASHFGGEFRDIHIRHCTGTNLVLTTVDLSGTEDMQNNIFEHITIRAADITAAKGMTLGSHTNGGANTCFNTFRQVYIYVANGTALEVGDADNNFFSQLHIGRSGTATGIDLLGTNGPSSFSGWARNTTFVHVDTGSAPVIARGTSSYTYPSDQNFMMFSRDNSMATPTIETGAGFTWQDSYGDVRYRRVSIGTALAVSSSPLLLANNAIVSARNNAGSGDVPLWRCNTLDELQIDATSRFNGTITMTDGINIVCGNSTGTRIGTSTTGQKIGFFNKAPVTQRSAITSPTADVTALKTAVDALRQVLIDLGLTA